MLIKMPDGSSIIVPNDYVTVSPTVVVVPVPTPQAPPAIGPKAKPKSGPSAAVLRLQAEVEDLRADLAREGLLRERMRVELETTHKQLAASPAAVNPRLVDDKQRVLRHNDELRCAVERTEQQREGLRTELEETRRKLWELEAANEKLRTLRVAIGATVEPVAFDPADWTESEDLRCQLDLEPVHNADDLRALLDAATCRLELLQAHADGVRELAIKRAVGDIDAKSHPEDVLNALDDHTGDHEALFETVCATLDRGVGEQKTDRTHQDLITQLENLDFSDGELEERVVEMVRDNAPASIELRMLLRQRGACIPLT